MKSLTLILAAGVVGAFAVSAATRAEAGAFSGAEGIRIASNDVSTIQNVQYDRRYGRPGYPYGYGYAPGYHGPDIHEQLGDGSIRRAGVGGYSDAAFGFSPTGSISDGR
jgi:hypothetical protein